MNDNYSQICSGCQKTLSADQFLNDPNLRVIGMAYQQADKKTYFFFHHDLIDCGTTILIEAGDLAFMANEFDFLLKSDNCNCGSDFGINLGNLENCNNRCDITPYKELQKVMLNTKYKNTH